MRHPRLRQKTFQVSPVYRLFLNPLFIILSPIIIPIRILIILVVIVLNFITDSILLRIEGNLNKPLSIFGTIYLKITKLITYRAICLACSVHIKVIGKQDAKIFISNHSSLFDIPVLIASGNMCTISKAGVLKLKLVKPGILVSRSLLARTSQGTAIDKLKERYTSKDSQWPSISVFATGTTVENDCVIPFRSGAFQPLQPVQIVNITYQTSRDFTYTIQSSKSVLKNILLNPFGQVTVEYLDVIDPNEGESPTQFAYRAQQIYAEKTNKTFCLFDYKDCLYFSGIDFEPSELYKENFGWMGTHKNYTTLCLKQNKDPYVQYSKEELIFE